MMAQSDTKIHQEQWNELTMDQPERQRAYKRNIQARSRNHCYCGKSYNFYIFRVCVRKP
jgi:hypothetical protein